MLSPATWMLLPHTNRGPAQQYSARHRPQLLVSPSAAVSHAQWLTQTSYPQALTAGKQQLGTGAGITTSCPAAAAAGPLCVCHVGPSRPVNTLCIPTKGSACTSSKPETAHLDVSQLCSTAIQQIAKLWASADVSTSWGSAAASKVSMLGSCAD